MRACLWAILLECHANDPPAPPPRVLRDPPPGTPGGPHPAPVPSTYGTVFTNHKAGMDAVDFDRVRRATYEASLGSAHFLNEQRKEADLAARLGVRPESAEVSTMPVLAVFATAALMALVLAGGLSGFMGIAICLLAMLKLMDVPAFAASFRKYDLLSQRWRAWAGFYPGVELLVGLGVLLRPERPVAEQLIGATALLLGLMGMVSVGKAVFVDKLALNCACVGGNAKVPLGVVSFSENLLMALMGAVMLVAG